MENFSQQPLQSSPFMVCLHKDSKQKGSPTVAKKQFTEEEARQRKNARQREYNKRTSYASTNKYHKEQTKIIPIRISISTEKDIMDWLEAQPNKAGYIKQLIREDIKRTESIASESNPTGKIDK